METEARGVATSIGQGTFNAIVIEDYSFIVDHCLKVIGESQSLEYIVITRNDGFSLITMHQQWSVDTLSGDWIPALNHPLHAKIQFSELTDKKCLHYAHPFNFSGINWGWIHIGLSTDPINEAMTQLVSRSLVVFVVFSVLGLILSIVFTRSMIHPIHALNRITSQYTLGDKNVKADIQTGDEFEDLANSFNFMIDKINKMHDELEMRVKNRTRQLAETNTQLLNEIDIRKRIEARQKDLLLQLETANEELRSFAYVVSHDLKAPLRAIGSLIHWISQDYRDLFDETGKEQIDLLVNRAERMHGFIEGILQYTRLGRVHEEKQEIDLEEFVENLSDLLDIPKHITLNKKCRLPVIHYEKIYIEQIFQNLIGNAIKYMDKEEGTVSIDCRKIPGLWEFSIADNGPGIDPKYHEKIFQIFQTLAPRDEFESTGIGLTIVKKIIENAGGSIWITSNPGEGSTFYFTIPATEPEKPRVLYSENVEPKDAS